MEQVLTIGVSGLVCGAVMLRWGYPHRKLRPAARLRWRVRTRVR